MSNSLGTATIRFPLKVVGRLDGLPSGQVHKIAIDHQDSLWIAGPSGLARYDGNNIAVFDRRDGLSTQGLRTVLCTSDGTLWLGTDVGIDVMEHPGQFRPLVEQSEWTYGFVDQIAPLPDGRLLIAASSKLLAWAAAERRTSRAATELLDGYVSAILIEKSGTIWAAGPSLGLVRNGGSGFSMLPESGWKGVGRLLCLAPGIEDTILVGGSLGFAEIDASGSVVQEYVAATTGEPANAILLVEGELWVALGDKLHIFRQQASRWGENQVVFENCRVNSLSCDRFGNVWAATDSQGIVKISVLRRSITQLDIPATRSIYSVRRTHGDRYLIGGNQHAFELGVDRKLAVRPIYTSGTTPIWDLLEDSKGVLWVASEAGLFRVQDDQASQVGKGHEVLSSPCRVLLERKGGLLAGTRAGLVFIDDDEIHQIFAASGETLGYVYTLAEGPHGRLWAGTIGSGLWRETDGGLARLAGDVLTARGNTYAVALNPDGRLAILQDDRVVLIRDDGQILNTRKTEGPVAGWTVQWTPDNRLFIGTSSGLVEYDPDTLRIVREISPRLGTESWEFTTSRSLILGPDKRLICGLNSGLSIVDLESLNRIDEAPVADLSQLTWSIGQVEGRNAEFVVSPGNWTFEAEVNAVWYIDEDSVQYRYRLIGFDRKWSSWRKQRLIQYSSLPSGQYALEVQASSPLIGPGPKRKVANIRVREQGWLRSRIFSLLQVSRNAFADLGGQLRNRRLLQINRELEHEVQERTEQLARANSALRELNSELESLSLTDPLTGLPNRRNLSQTLTNEIKRAVRDRLPLTVGLLDIDHFKLFNDTHGHLEGDACLRRVSGALHQTLRDGIDLLARYGGEELAFVLPNTGMFEAERIAERLRSTVEELRIPHELPPSGSVVTISIGLATLESDSFEFVEPEELMSQADDALYRAKEGGRNRWISAKLQR